MGYEKLKRPLRVPGANLGAAEIRTAQLSLTAAQVKALRATPQALVAAPGEGFALQLLGGTVIYDYTAVFTETADNLVVRYTNGSGAAASAVSAVSSKVSSLTVAAALALTPLYCATSCPTWPTFQLPSPSMKRTALLMDRA